MKPSKHQYEIWVYFILIISATLAALLAVKNIKISPDSMRFSLISQQILSGNGIKVPIIRMEDPFVPINGAVPFLDQMPLLPLLFAMLGGVTPHSFLAAQIINIISHVAIAVFTFLLMVNMYENKGIALLTGVLVSISFPLLINTHNIWSESLFISLTVASVYFISLSRNSKHGRLRSNILIAGACASAAILTRNAGIALIPVLLWEFIVLVKNKRAGTNYFPTVLAVIMPIITTAAMFIRNYMVAGSFRGFQETFPNRPYVEAFMGTLDMIFRQFQLGRNAVILIAVLFFLFIIFMILNGELRKEFFRFSTTRMDPIIVFIVSYTVLIFLSMAKQQWHYDLRYISPIVPFLFICSILIIIMTYKAIKLEGFSKLSLTGLIVLLGMLALGNSYKTYLNFPVFSIEKSKHYSILQNCMYKWLKDNYDKHFLITTNRPYHLSFFGGYSTLALPHKRFNPEFVIPDDMESGLPKQMKKFGSRVLALFFEADEKYEGSYIAKLFNNRETDNTFSLVNECNDGVVYNLKE